MAGRGHGSRRIQIRLSGTGPGGIRLNGTELVPCHKDRNAIPLKTGPSNSANEIGCRFCCSRFFFGETMKWRITISSSGSRIQHHPAGRDEWVINSCTTKGRALPVGFYQLSLVILLRAGRIPGTRSGEISGRSRLPSLPHLDLPGRSSQHIGTAHTFCRQISWKP